LELGVGALLDEGEGASVAGDGRSDEQAAAKQTTNTSTSDTKAARPNGALVM
jgi:hypothetical protein